MRFYWLSFLLLSFTSWPHTGRGQCPPPSPASPPWLSPPASPFVHHLSLPSGAISANVYVDPVPGGSNLGRPFVFVEGIDFGLGEPSNPWRNGDFGWRQFHGCDSANYPMMAWMPVLLDSIRTRGFTPVLIDFADGTADLTQNAMLLADILLHLRDHRDDPRPMVISGASMGGQLARMALRHLEITQEPHCQQLYVSLDSPHAGANVPLGLQHTLHFLSGDDGLVDDLVSALSSPAARQLLDVQLLSLQPRVEQRFLMDSIGYPEQCRNVAIANGSWSSLPGQDDPLLDYEHALIESGWFGEIGELITLQIHPQPGEEQHPLATPSQSVLSVVEHPESEGWPWPLQLHVGHANAGSSIPWDHLPGGTRPSIAQFVEAFNTNTADTNSTWPSCIPPISEAQFQPLHSFIPTASALGLESFDTELDTNWLQSATPFDAVHWAPENEPHSEINPENLEFLLHEMDRIECPISPGVVVSDTNITSTGHWAFSGFQVDGELGLQSSDPDLSTTPSPEQSFGTFRLHGCSSPIHVLPGGHLQLGASDTGGGSAAHLIIENGATLLLEGPLTLHAGSKLEVLSGGKVEFDGGYLDLREGAELSTKVGAELQFSDNAFWSCSPGSVVSIDGQGIMAPDVTWAIHWGGEVTWKTQGQFELTGGSGSQLEMHAIQGEQGWQVAPTASLSFIGLEHIIAHPFGLHLEGETKAEMEVSGHVFWKGHWRGQSADSVSILGDLYLQEALLSELQVNQSSGLVRMEDCQAQFGGAEFEGKSIIVSSEFQNFKVHLTSPGPLEVSRIEDSGFAEGLVGLMVSGNGPIHIEESRFERLGIGVQLKSSVASILCSEFRDNDIGLHIDRSATLMSPAHGGGWNRFESNDTHMQLIQAPLPELVHGANHFGAWGSQWAQGSVDLMCSGSGVDWNITGQSWNWPSGWAQIQVGLQTTTQPPCPVQAVDLNPTSMQDCKAGLQGKKE